MAISATRSLREEQVVTNFARNFSIHDRDACDRNKFRSLSVQPTVKSSQQKSTMNRCIFCVINGLMILIKPLGCSRPMLQQNSFHDLVHPNRENIRKAGGTGLNLTAADYVIQMDHWWNPAAEDQAIDVLTGSDNIAR